MKKSANQLYSKRLRRRQRQGAVMVEFALCATIFFLFVFTLLEYSRYIYVRHAIQMSAYEAARVGVVPGASREDVAQRADRLLRATGVRSASVRIDPEEINSLTEEVSVQVSADFARNSWLPPRFLKNRFLESTITLQHENMAFLQPGDSDLESIFGNNEDEPIDE